MIVNRLSGLRAWLPETDQMYELRLILEMQYEHYFQYLPSFGHGLFAQSPQAQLVLRLLKEEIENSS